MTTAWAGEPGAAAVDAHDADAAPAADLAPSPPEERPAGPDVPRLPHRLSALLVLLVLPLAVALTVAAMTLMLPSGDADRAGAATSALSRVRVAVLDGGDDAELVRLVADRLAAAGITVVASGPAPGGPYDRTEVVYHDAAAEMTAAEVRRVLRVGKVVLDRSFSGAAEVSIIVGKDVRYA